VACAAASHQELLLHVFYELCNPIGHARYNWQLVLFFCSAAILDPFLNVF
jgi:hypothetical protein